MARQYLPKGMQTANMPMAVRAMDARGASLPRRFITIAQQIGAECDGLPQRLAEVLSACEPQAPVWSRWDREMAERVSASSHIPAELVTSLETSGHSWLDDLLTGLSGRTDEMVVFHAIKQVVRELARAGHVILVGHGSIYLTRDLPGGLHVRLIAPTDLRILNVASRFNIPPAQAARHMRRLDRQRATFFRRFWPDRPLAPEMLAATLNVGELNEEQLTRAIVGMLRDDRASSVAG